jgi:hypothetical protein
MQTKVKGFSIVTILLVLGFQLLGIHSFAFNATFDLKYSEVIEDTITTQNQKFTTDSSSDPIYFFAEFLEEEGEENLEEESIPKKFSRTFSHLGSNSTSRIALQTLEADSKFHSRKVQPPYSLPLYIKYLVFRL